MVAHTVCCPCCGAPQQLSVHFAWCALQSRAEFDAMVARTASQHRPECELLYEAQRMLAMVASRPELQPTEPAA